MSDDHIGDALRRLAHEAPSDEGLLASVHLGVAHARVRRRVALSSTAAAAVLLAGVGLFAWGGDEPTRRPGQTLLGAPSPTTATASPTPTPEPLPSTSSRPDRPNVAPEPSADPSGTPAPPYLGRAVAADGSPIPGLFVYALTGLRSMWFDTPYATTTDADGRFALDCPSGPVLLTPYRLGELQDGHTPNWRPTYVGGGHLLGEATAPPCGVAREDTVVPPGGVVSVILSGPPDCAATFVAKLQGSDTPGHLGYDQDWLGVPAGNNSTTRVVGLPPATYSVVLQQEEGVQVIAQESVTITDDEELSVSFTVDDATCGNPAPSPAPTESPAPEATGQP